MVKAARLLHVVPNLLLDFGSEYCSLLDPVEGSYFEVAESKITLQNYAYNFGRMHDWGWRYQPLGQLVICGRVVDARFPCGVFATRSGEDSPYCAAAAALLSENRVLQRCL